MKKNSIVDFFKILFVEVPSMLFNIVRILMGVVARYGKTGEKIGFFVVGGVVIIGVLLVIGIEGSSTNAFCLQCHPYLAKEFYESPHGKAGVTCADCHIPKNIVGFTKVKLGGLRETWIYLTQPHPTTYKDWYDHYKVKWEKLAYKDNLTESACLQCHGAGKEYPYMKVKFEGINIHEALKVKEKGLSCFDCHYNFVHGYLGWREKMK